MKARFIGVGSCFFACLLTLLANFCTEAAGTNRGVWCWATPGPYGLNYIVGTNALENAAIAQFKKWGISHVYGFYGTQLQTVSGQAALAAWNTLLSNNGIESQFLISDYSLGSGDNNFVLEVINFNQNQPTAAQFRGIHLDLEPWGMSSWATDSKYNDLTNLASEYQQVRTELNTNGQSNVLVYADLSDWLDTTIVNWPSDSARDQWFSGILTNLASITLMAYEQSSYSQLVNVSSWELVSHPGVVRIGIDAGMGETWSNLTSFATVARQLESNFTDSVGVDIYDFTAFESVMPPVLGAGPIPASTTNSFNLMLQGPVGSNYVIQASSNLINWQSFTNFLSTSWVTCFNDSAMTNYPYRFYRVTN